MNDARDNSFRHVWLPVALLWFVACLNYLDRLMITTMRDPIKASIPMTDAEFALLTSVFLWIYGALSPFAGYLADRFSRRTVIVVSLVVWSAVTWLTGRAHTFHELLCARAVMGLSEACYIPAALALIADYHRGPTRSLATGLHMSGIYAGAALGGLGGVIAEKFGWRLGFTLFGSIGVVYASVLCFFLQNASPSQLVVSDPHSHGGSGSHLNVSGAFRALFSQPAFLLLLLLNALVSIANWGINGWLPTYLKEHFGLGLGAAGMSATGYIQVASFCGVLVGGAWADYWSRENSRGRAFVPAIGYLIAAPCLFFAANTNLFWGAILGLIVFGLGRGFFDANLMPIQRQIADERYSATGYGFLNFIGCTAGGVINYVGGRMLDAGMPLANVFKFSAIGLLFVALLLFTIRPRIQKMSEIPMPGAMAR